MTHERCYTGGCRAAGLVFQGVPFACDLPEEVEEAAGNWNGPNPSKFPMRNDPRFVNWLIAHYSHDMDCIFDPMAGSGTTMEEAEKLGRSGWGWDCVPEYRDLWPDRIWGIGSPRTADLILTSPDYWGNHSPGKTQRQEDLTARAKSRAGEAIRLVPESIGGAHDWTIYVARLHATLYGAANLLRPGGHFIVIVREKIRRGKPTSLAFITDLCLRAQDGLVKVVNHWRRIEPTHQYQKRAKLAAAQGKPKPPYVDREYALVWRRSP